MMTSPIQHLTQSHLTNEQLDDLLLGLGTAADQAHLDACALCSAQLAPFQGSVAAFNDSTLAWAQAKSNTISRDLSTVRISSGRRQPMAWAGGVAMVAAVGFAIGVSLHPATSRLDPTPATQNAATADNAQEIAADNAMLAAIDSEIGTAAPAPLQPFRTSGTHSHRTSANEVTN